MIVAYRLCRGSGTARREGCDDPERSLRDGARPMSGRLDGKVAVVTGSGGAGLGRAGARLFAAEGAKVVVLDVREDGVEETVRLIREEGGEAVGLRTDTTRLVEMQAM